MARPDSQASRVADAIADSLHLISQLSAVTSMPRRYVAELIVVRMFSLFEAVVEDSACRLVCGAPYCDGSVPALLRTRPCRGLDQARDAIRTFNRTSPRFVRWNRANEIVSNLEKLFPPSEHFVVTMVGHSGFLDDLRKVRNHIAHGNEGTHRHFQNVVAARYGAKVPGLTPGRMLLSSRFKPLLLEQYCRQTGAILRAAIKA